MSVVRSSDAAEMLNATDDEELISLLSRPTPQYILPMLEIPTPSPLPSPSHTPPRSPLGTLDRLPLELLHTILSTLSLHALSALTRTCHRAITIIHALPSFRAVLIHAPHALRALARTHLLRHFTAADVHAALLSPTCTSCGRYGPCLFLPTCVRCCATCLLKNQSFRVVPVALAQETFGFTPAVPLDAQLPVMHTIPGSCSNRHIRRHDESVRVVCVGAAKKLALLQNRSEEKLRSALDARYAAKLLDEDEYWTQRFLLAAPLAPPGFANIEHIEEPIFPPDDLGGMASMYFPFLGPGGRVEHGVYCAGCVVYTQEWKSGWVVPGFARHLVDRGIDERYALCVMSEVPRSRAEFGEHVMVCPGARLILERQAHEGRVREEED